MRRKVGSWQALSVGALYGINMSSHQLKPIFKEHRVRPCDFEQIIKPRLSHSSLHRMLVNLLNVSSSKSPLKRIDPGSSPLSFKCPFVTEIAFWVDKKCQWHRLNFRHWASVSLVQASTCHLIIFYMLTSRELCFLGNKLGYMELKFGAVIFLFYNVPALFNFWTDYAFWIFVHL